MKSSIIKIHIDGETLSFTVHEARDYIENYRDCEDRERRAIAMEHKDLLDEIGEY